MELKWLHDFVSLANTANFSRSAEERHVTQSAFSRRIQSLENWLGTELFDRKTHPITLTDSGIRFLKPAKNMIRQAERIKDDFSDQNTVARSLITFTSSNNLALSFLPKWINEAQRNFGQFDVKVQTDISGIQDYFESLRNKQSDFLLHYGHGVDMFAMDANKFDYAVVGRDVLLPVCHQSLKNTVEDSLNSKSPKSLPYASPWRTSSIAYLIAEKIAQNNSSTRLDTVAESSIVGCTKGFVEEGVAIAWLPKSSVDQELESGKFIRLFDESFEIPLSIEIYRYSSNSDPVNEKFWEYIQTTQLS